jgi:hypothetical protein
MAAPRIDPKRLRPSRAWYWVAGALIVLSVVVAGYLFFSILRPLFDPIDNFTAPGSVTVDLDGGDQRTIYTQTTGIDTPVTPTLVDVSPNDLACTVTGPGGKRLDLSRADGFTYTKNNDEYRAKLEFKASDSGEHVVRCAYRPAPAERIALAVGPHFGTVGFVTRLLLFFVVLFGGLLLGIGLAVLVAVLRQRSKKRLQREEMGSWPPPGGQAPPPPDFMNAGR